MKLKTIKFKQIITVFMSIILCLTFSVTANAATSSGGSSTSSSTSSGSESSDNTDEKSADESSKSSDENSGDVDLSDDEDTVNYSWSTNTTGNSSLVANEEILLDNGYYQFIAVTTRDDDVFYIIIDETKTEDNVYFLNEVDTYDINKLLGENSESGNSETVEENIEATQTTVEATSSQSNSSSGNSQFYIILVIGVIFLGGIVFAIYKLKGKKKSSSNEHDNNEFEFEEDDEINEDYEEVKKDGNEE